MKNETKKAKSKEMFDGLILNAINFLEESVSELEKNPKYSLINFCTAVELFLKARLMLEHWSLIYEDPKTANFNKFLQGDFKSIGMSEAIKRLKNVLDLEITEDEKQCFNKIRDHRNQLIHFFNKAYTNELNKKSIEIVVLEECKGWFYLHQILTRRWKGEFDNYTSKLERLNKLMIANRKYLKAKYVASLPEIDRMKKQHTSFSSCQSCGFDSGKEKIIEHSLNSGSSLVDTDCLVCELQSRELRVPCIEDCEGIISILDMGEGECEICQTTIGMKYLLDNYADPVNLDRDTDDRDQAYIDLKFYQLSKEQFDEKLQKAVPQLDCYDRNFIKEIVKEDEIALCKVKLNLVYPSPLLVSESEVFERLRGITISGGLAISGSVALSL